jgi:hypothetical protein
MFVFPKRTKFVPQFVKICEICGYFFKPTPPKVDCKNFELHTILAAKQKLRATRKS